MARRYGYSRPGSFAEGFAGGFGLMSDFYDSKNKQELAAEELASDKMYREGLLRDREETREIERKRGLRLDNIAETQAGTARINAETARQNALNEANKWNPDGSEKISALDQANIDAAGARQSASEAKRDLAEFNLDKQELESLNNRNATHLTNLSALAKALDREGLAAYIEANKEDIFNDRSFLSGLKLHDPRRPGFHARISEDIKQIAQGAMQDPNFKMSDESIAGFSALFRGNANNYIGKTLDASFQNAPESLHGGVVTDSFISDIKSSANGVTADVSVEVEMPNGDIQYYTAPMTRNASELDTELTSITMDEGIMSIAATQGAMDFLKEDPVIQNQIEIAYMTQRFGSPKEFQDRVTTETNKIITYLTSEETRVTGATTVGDIDFLTDQGFEPTMTVGELMSNQAAIREKVSENLLYGISPVTKKREADKFIGDIKSALPGTRYAVTATGAAMAPRMKGRTSAGDSGLLSNLIDGGVENLTNNQMIDLYNMINQSNDPNFDGVIRGEELEQIKYYLNRYGKLAK